MIATSEAVGMGISHNSTAVGAAGYHLLLTLFRCIIVGPDICWLRHPTCSSILFMLSSSSSCFLRTSTWFLHLQLQEEHGHGLHGSVWQEPSSGRRQLIAGGSCYPSLSLSLSHASITLRGLFVRTLLSDMYSDFALCSPFIRTSIMLVLCDPDHGCISVCCSGNSVLHTSKQLDNFHA